MIRALPDTPDFSHCRAVAEALRRLAARGVDAGLAAPAIASVLRRAGVGGHAQVDLVTVQRDHSTNPNDNAVRNRSLRELVLSASLLRCGDVDDLGRTTLLGYAADLRGHYRRHALAVLNESPGLQAKAARS